MSRIGNKLIALEDGVTATINGSVCTVKGKNGTLSVKIPHKIHVQIEGKEIKVTRDDDLMQTKELHGTTRALIHDACVGCDKGFEKTLTIKGTGYRARMNGNAVVLKVGYSHEVTIAPEEGVTIKITDKDGTVLVISGNDKQKVGQTAAVIRDVRRPEPYGGKGIKYKEEVIVHKEGKRAAAATGGGAAAPSAK